MKRKYPTFANYILDKIHKKAEMLFPFDLVKQDLPDSSSLTSSENWKLWEDFYLKAAEEVYKEFETEGLHQTCVAIRELIDEQRKFINYHRKETEKV